MVLHVLMQTPSSARPHRPINLSRHSVANYARANRGMKPGSFWLELHIYLSKMFIKPDGISRKHCTGAPDVSSGLHALAKVRTEFACPFESRLPPPSLPRDLVTSPARSLGAKYEFDESGSGRPNSDVTFFHGRDVLCHT